MSEEDHSPDNNETEIQVFSSKSKRPKQNGYHKARDVNARPLQSSKAEQSKTPEAKSLHSQPPSVEQTGQSSRNLDELGWDITFRLHLEKFFWSQEGCILCLD